MTAAEPPKSFVLEWPSADHIERRLRSKIAGGVRALEEELHVVVRLLGFLEDARVLLTETTGCLSSADLYSSGIGALGVYVDHAFRRSVDYVYALQCLSEGIAAGASDQASIEAAVSRAKRSYYEHGQRCTLNAQSPGDKEFGVYVAMLHVGAVGLFGDRRFASVAGRIEAWLTRSHGADAWDEVDLRPVSEYLKRVCATYMALQSWIDDTAERERRKNAERAVERILSRCDDDNKNPDETSDAEGDDDAPGRFEPRCPSAEAIRSYVRGVARMDKTALETETAHVLKTWELLQEATRITNMLIDRQGGGSPQLGNLLCLEQFLHTVYSQAADVHAAVVMVSNRLDEGTADEDAIAKAVERSVYGYDERACRCTLTMPPESHLVEAVRACDSVRLDHMYVTRINHDNTVRLGRMLADLLEKAPVWLDADLEPAAEYADALSNLDSIVQAALRLSHEKRDPEGARRVAVV